VPGLVPRIHVLSVARRRSWIAGRPGLTAERCDDGVRQTNSSERWIFEQRRRVAEKQPVAGTAADAHHHKIVIAPLELAENSLIRSALRDDRGADAHVVAVGDRHNIFQDRLLVTACPDAAPHSAAGRGAHRDVNVWRTSLRSVSIPASKSNSRIPNCEMPSIIAFCSGFFGNSACCT
jgi:hypothetical protein